MNFGDWFFEVGCVFSEAGEGNSAARPAVDEVWERIVENDALSDGPEDALAGLRAAFAKLRDGLDERRESSDELRDGFSEGGAWVVGVGEWFDEGGGVSARVGGVVSKH